MRFLVVCALISEMVLGTETCTTWFKKSKLNPQSRSCFAECITLSVGMNSYGCPLRCHEFCKFSKRVWVYFGNGMFTSKSKAIESADALGKGLKALVESRYPDLAPMIANISLASVAYNNDEGLFLQLLEVFSQKAGAEAQSFLKWLSDLSLAPPWFRELATRIAFGIGKVAEITDADLRQHLSEYGNHLKKGDAVVIVPHSQGNIYAAEAYQRLFNEYGFTMDVALNRVATPQSEDGTVNMDYTTLYSDGVIRLVPHSEPPNVRNNPSGLFDHQFIKHYLSGNSSGPKILITTACLISKFRQLPPNINSLYGQTEHHSCQDVPEDDISEGEE